MLEKYLLALSLMSPSFVWLVQTRVEGLTEEQYLRINLYLANNVATNDVFPNMKKAASWLLKLTNPTGARIDETLVAALEKFTALSKLDSNTKCNKESYDILTANDRATAGYIRVMRPNEVPDCRVDMIVHHYAMQHARQCKDVYPISYQNKLKQMDVELVRRVENFISPIIWKSKFKFLHKDATASERLVSKYFADTDPSIRGIENARLALKAMKYLAKNDPHERCLELDKTTIKGKVSADEEVKELFKKYLVEPCKYYISKLGSDIFLPAKFDASIYHKVDESKVDFYFAMGKFRLCDSLVNRDQNSLVEDVIALIRSQPLD